MAMCCATRFCRSSPPSVSRSASCSAVRSSTETIFGWPGVGREIVAAIGSKDFYVVQAGVIMLALIFAGVNLMIDLVYMWIDPRIRYGD